MKRREELKRKAEMESDLETVTLINTNIRATDVTAYKKV
jgi:hypothetical protein